MRILTVSAFYESHQGGIEIVAGALARALAKRGHTCSWAAAAFDPPPADPLVRPVPLVCTDPLERRTGLPMPLPNGSARALLEREVADADAVIVHDALYASSLVTARLARRHGKPWLLVQHIGAIPYTNPLLRLAMAAANRVVARPMIRSAPIVVFISDLVRQHFKADLRPGAGVLMFNGVDHSLFHAARATQASPLRERRQLLFVGRFVEKKGLDALRALAVLEADWDLLLIGCGPLDPSAWGLSNVHVLGRKGRAALAELYRTADALVLPSVGEGFPLVIQEAMASGLPVVCGLDSAHADPGATRFLHGVRVDPADPTGTAARFADAVRLIDARPDRAAAAYARATYDWDHNAAWLVQTFSKLAS